ncbi:hypothetical protein TRFO_38102 [Tritrichomonas foetus]|uniref:Importin N-terminal domain-containing protein n=1 Tax=Tritrichomonas foetus TaxID=1144522 RepID=A0A1J4JEA8_9EUKA|nr:hypothetical protein TRFO_38102 [Tritrichomonas foetus]|eukprot:OHS95773.1 hypothetical protein TRFO_38102 [Tritrichomonas foetus]
MSLSVDDLENILAQFSNATNDENMNSLKYILDQWRDSPMFLPQTMQIIQESSNTNLIVYAVAALNLRIVDYLKSNTMPITKEDLVKLYQMSFTKILQMNQSPESCPAVSMLIKLASLATVCFPQLLSNFSNLPPDLLIYYLDEVILEETNISMLINNFGPNHSTLMEICDSNVPAFFEILTKAAVCNQTFNFMVTLLSKTDPCNYVVFLPLFQQALTTDDCIKGILNVLENIVGIEVTNLNPNDFLFIKPFFELLISYAERTTEVNYSSFIWYQIIDTTFEFFGNPSVGQEYATMVFGRFFNSLNRFIEEDIEEFNALMAIYASCIFYIPVEQNFDGNNYSLHEFMTPFIEGFLDYIVSLVNRDLSFCNKNISQCLFELCKKIYEPEDEEEEENDDIFGLDNSGNSTSVNALIQIARNYYTKRLETQPLSNGLVYVLSYAPKNIMKVFASTIAVQLKSLPEPPVTTVYFCRFWSLQAENSIIPLIHICYKAFNFLPMKDIGKALLAIVKNYGAIFANDPNTFLPPIIEIIQKADKEIASPFFSTLFIIFQYISPKDQNAKEFMQNSGAAFLSHVNHQINSPEEFKSTIKFVYSIIKHVIPNNDLTKAFCQSLFAQFGFLNQFLLMQVDEIQEYLCALMAISLEHNWVQNRQTALDWIDNVINVYPVIQHFDVLYQLVDLLPTPKFLEFLSHTDQFNESLVEAEAEFFSKIYPKYPQFITRLPIDLILYPLQSNKAAHETINLLSKMVKSLTFTQEDYEKVVNSVLACYFNVCTGGSWANALVLLKMLGIRYSTKGPLLEQIFKIVGPGEQKDFEEFAQVFLNEQIVDYHSHDYVSQKIIRTYKANHHDT